MKSPDLSSFSPVSRPEENQPSSPMDIPCMSDPSKPNGFVINGNDGSVAWLKEVEELKKVSQILELILDNVYSGIIFCDRNCNIIFMNQVYAELLGVDRERAIGRPITDFFPRSRLPQVVRTGTPELGQRCSLKGEVPFLVNRIPIKKGNQTIGIILQ